MPYRATMAKPEVRFLLRLPPDLYEAARATAAANNRSMNAELILLIAAGLAADAREQPSK